MKDITKKINEKENHSQVSNSLEYLQSKLQSSNSFHSIISLTSLNNKDENTQTQRPRITKHLSFEYKSIDLKSTYSSLTQRPLKAPFKMQISNRPEAKQKTSTSIQVEQNNISIQFLRKNQSLNIVKPAEIETISITEYKKIELNKYMADYSDELIDFIKDKEKTTCQLQFLKKHSISANLRAKMIDWMVEVLSSYKCRDQTFFMAVRLMDQYLSLEEQPQSANDLHLIGVTTMFLASKYEEIYPVKLNVVFEKIGHKKLPKEEIKNKESDITKTLDFNLVGFTLHEIVFHLLYKLNLSSKTQQFFNKTCTYLTKMVLYDYDLVSSNLVTNLSAAIIVVAMKIVEQVDPTFQSETQIQIASSILKVPHEEAMELANRVLNLAKNFSKQFPNLENLQKFNKFSFEH